VLTVLLISLLIGLVIRVLHVSQGWQTLRAFADFRRSANTTMACPTPSVSVLIPARNEERNIGPCLNSGLQQDFPVTDITVVDDGSTDSTAEIVEEIQRRDHIIQLVRIRELPPGWIGKNYALHRGAQTSKSDYLLLLDADVRLSPGCLAHTMRYALQQDSDLVTMFPAVKWVTFWEKVILPIWGEIFLPMAGTMGPNPEEAKAFGGYLLFKRETYDRIGGHERVRNAIVEDVALARIVKREGYRFNILSGWPDLLTARMYTSFTHIWEGIGKTLMGLKAWQLVIGSYLALAIFVLPWFSIPISLLYHSLYGWDWLTASILTLGVCSSMFTLLIRWYLAKVVDCDNTYPYLEPLGGLIVVAMLVNSLMRMTFHRGAKWKGRRYTTYE
jgi:chlorobactene glucosyltransferase